MQTDESVRGHIDLIRVLAGVVGVLGLIYAGLAQGYVVGDTQAGVGANPETVAKS